MFPACTMMGGQCFAFPDTCLTPAPPAPPIPIPYPNIGMMMQAVPPSCSKKVMIMNQPIIVLMSTISMTSGDEAGANMGVMSGMIKGPVSFKKGSSKVMVEGQPVVMHLGPAAQNGASANAPGGTIVAPSQAKVILKS